MTYRVQIIVKDDNDELLFVCQAWDTEDAQAAIRYARAIEDFDPPVREVYPDGYPKEDHDSK